MHNIIILHLWLFIPIFISNILFLKNTILLSIENYTSFNLITIESTGITSF